MQYHWNLPNNNKCYWKIIIEPVDCTWELYTYVNFEYFQRQSKEYLISILVNFWTQ